MGGINLIMAGRPKFDFGEGGQSKFIMTEIRLWEVKAVN